MIANLQRFICDRFRPFIRRMKYKGFCLYYSRGFSLIGRIEKEGVYEKTLSKQIIAVLEASTQPVFLDIGANIGLISLNILEEIPQTIIYAFEPGPHQHFLLSKTIEENKIGNMFLYKVALSDDDADRTFSVHKPKHSSGDGFVDTGRAGPSKTIVVKCQTLDQWWLSNDKPLITAIKIDTEGAELLVLKGSNTVISYCKPTIFIEIWPDNLRGYPYNPMDILAWMDVYHYALYCLDGKQVTLDNSKSFWGIHESFMARPVI